jgi:hypothetical protein
VFFLKPEKSLFISFYILLNLAEDVNTERKMIKKGLLNICVNSCLATDSYFNWFD